MTRPVPSSDAVRDRFKRQRTRDTAPEISLRRELHRRGLRYRVDYRALPGERWKVDIAFLGPRVAVNVDGCFWHSCPDHGLQPKANSDWWRQKLARTVDRDRRVDRALIADGWLVLRIWEHENPELAADRIETLIRQRVEQPRPST